MTTTLDGNYRAFLSADTHTVRFATGLTLESGVHLPELCIAYRSWGERNAAGDNAVVICHALTGSADADEWWGPLFGVAFDPAYDYIVCANLLGSCYGTTGPTSNNPETGRVYGPDFPAITLRDMVAAQAKLLRHLGVTRIKLVIGGSLGGMLALEWALLEPEWVAAVASIAACGRHSAWCIGLSHAQRAALLADPAFCGGHYPAAAPPAAGLAAARMLGMCTYRGPQSFAARHDRRPQLDTSLFSIQSYLDHQGQKLVSRFDANSYLALLAAMDTHDLARGRGEYEAVLRRIETPALIITYDTDLLYPQSDQQELALRIPNATWVMLHSLHGHDAFLIDMPELAKHIKRFRQNEKASRP